MAAFNSIGGSYRSYATEVTTLQGLPSPCSPFMSPTYRVWDLGSLGVYVKLYFYYLLCNNVCLAGFIMWLQV